MRPRSRYVRLVRRPLRRDHGRWPDGLLVGLLLVELQLASCRSTLDPASGDPRRDLQHADPRVRIGAAEQAVRQSRLDLCGLLVKNLDDPDGAVRLFSSVALKKLTGEDFGYAAHGTLVERDEAVERWKRWLESEGLLAREVGPFEAPPPSSPPPPSPSPQPDGASVPDSGGEESPDPGGALPPARSPAAPPDSAAGKSPENDAPREKKSDENADDSWVGAGSNSARS